MKAMICDCCGGQIDPITLKCKYCQTAYERDLNDEIIRIETFQNPIKIFGSQMLIDDYIIEMLGENEASKVVKKELSLKLARAIAECMEIRCVHDPVHMRREVSARIRIVEPNHLF